MARLGAGSRGTTSTATRRSRGVSMLQLLLTLALCSFAFFAGTTMCTHACLRGDAPEAFGGAAAPKESRPEKDDGGGVEAVARERLRREAERLDGELWRPRKNDTRATKDPRFPPEMRRFARGAVRVGKEDFVALYDGGNPVDNEKPGESEALILYASEGALPPDASAAAMYGDGNGFPLVGAAEATRNCEEMSVVFTDVPFGSSNDVCLAIVGNYQSYHVHRWLRYSRRGGRERREDETFPLIPVSRGVQWKNLHNDFTLPGEREMRMHWNMLSDYFSFFDDVLAELRPIAERVAIGKTIIVLTCNLGQSDLLMNFVCTAKARGISLKNVLVFPTDKETQAMAEGLGLATYYDKRNFQSMPKKEASFYGDATFTRMMFAKVFCIHLLLSLGYDLLYSDVDVVLFRDPLEYFRDKPFDIILQDDGARTVRYAPYCGNSGFYFVRNRPVTRYLFTSLLYSGDKLLRWDSHQQVLVQLISEYTSLFALRAKVMNTRTTTEFPGGWHFHRNKDFMRKVAKGEISPYIFHMSWTTNKINKVKFLQQFGEWRVSDKCKVNVTLAEIIGDEAQAGGDALAEHCCLAEPKKVCYYRDKPSKWPCKDSPALDRDVRSFW